MAGRTHTERLELSKIEEYIREMRESRRRVERSITILVVTMVICAIAVMFSIVIALK